MGLSISAVWNATQAAITSRFGDFALPAAAFVLLPQAVLGLYGPRPETFEATFAAMSSPWSVLVNLIALLGQLAILDLALRPRAAVGGSIRRAAALWPLGLVVLLLLGAALIVGFTLLILPGLFLLGRLLLVFPAYVDQNAGVASAFRETWQRTRRAWLKILGAVILFLMAAMVAMAVAFIAGGLVEGGEAGLVTALATSAVSAVFTIYFAVFQAKLYVALAPSEVPA